MLKYLVLFSVSLFLTLLLTPFVRFAATKLGALDLPGERKIHTHPTPRLGGLSIFLVFNVVLLFSSSFEFFFFPINFLNDINFKWLFAASAIVVGIGAVDDLKRLSPGVKLLFQALAGFLVATTSFRIDFIVLPLLGPLHLGAWSIPMTLLWIVAITNAINLLDGLDGLAAGTSLIVCIAMFGISLLQQNIGAALISAILAGSILGFLKYNFHPASIFLGDSGAYYLGFTLSVLSLLSNQKGSTALAILIPIVALGLPIIDTFISMLRRLLASLHIMEVDQEKKLVKFFYIDGWSVFKADKDHIHHRLLNLGFTHRNAVILLYGVSLSLGVIALSTIYFKNINYAMVITTIAIAAYTGVKKLGYKEIQILSNGSLLRLFDAPIVHRKITQVFIDMASISLSFYLAFLLRFDEGFFPWKNYYMTAIPLILLTKIVVFYLAGLYNGGWKYTSIGDLLKVVKTVFWGSLLSWLLLEIIPGYSIHTRALLIIDFNLLLVFAVGTRISFRVLEHLHISQIHQVKKVLIYGAGKTGVSTLNDVLNNPTLGLSPVGFIDDYAENQGRQINGYPVLGTLRTLDKILEKNSISEVILSQTITKGKLESLLQICAAHSTPLRRFETHFEEASSIDRVKSRGGPARRKSHLMANPP